MLRFNSNIGPTSLDLTWTAPSSPGSASIDYYRIMVASDAHFSEFSQLDTTTNPASYHASNLQPLTNYTFEVMINERWQRP